MNPGPGIQDPWTQRSPNLMSPRALRAVSESEPSRSAPISLAQRIEVRNLHQVHAGGTLSDREGNSQFRLDADATVTSSVPELTVEVARYRVARPACGGGAERRRRAPVPPRALVALVSDDRPVAHSCSQISSCRGWAAGRERTMLHARCRAALRSVRHARPQWAHCRSASSARCNAPSSAAHASSSPAIPVTVIVLGVASSATLRVSPRNASTNVTS